jgi:hypothetical protein
VLACLTPKLSFRCRLARGSVSSMNNDGMHKAPRVTHRVVFEYVCGQIQFEWVHEVLNVAGA